MSNLGGYIVVGLYTIVVGVIIGLNENIESTPEIRRQMHLFY